MLGAMLRVLTSGNPGIGWGCDSSEVPQGKGPLQAPSGH